MFCAHSLAFFNSKGADPVTMMSLRVIGYKLRLWIGWCTPRTIEGHFRTRKKIKSPFLHAWTWFALSDFEWFAFIEFTHFHSNHCIILGENGNSACLKCRLWSVLFVFQVEVVEGVAGEEDHHDDQEEQGEENAEAEGQHDEHDEDGETHPMFWNQGI